MLERGRRFEFTGGSSSVTHGSRAQTMLRFNSISGIRAREAQQVPRHPRPLLVNVCGRFEVVLCRWEVGRELVDREVVFVHVQDPEAGVELAADDDVSSLCAVARQTFASVSREPCIADLVRRVPT